MRCLVADDSTEVVARLSDCLKRQLPDSVLLPPAHDGHQALRRIRDYSPDLLLLDLEMPQMDGLTTLRALSGKLPTRTVVLAPETLEGGRAAWAALRLGAHDFLSKRRIRGIGAVTETIDRLDERLQEVVAPLLSPALDERISYRGDETSDDEIEELAALVFLVETRHLVRAASFLACREDPFPVPIVLQVPHPARFTRAIQEGLDRIITMPVRTAVTDEYLAPGQVVLVPGGYEASLRGEGFESRLRLVPVSNKGSLAARRAASIREFLRSSEAPIGLVLSGPLPDTTLNTARRSASDRRLFFLSERPGIGETAVCLETARALLTEPLSRVR